MYCVLWKKAEIPVFFGIAVDAFLFQNWSMKLVESFELFVGHVVTMHASFLIKEKTCISQSPYLYISRNELSNVVTLKN